jgi:hypothetical protein
MFSPGKSYSRPKFESIVGDRGSDLLADKRNYVLKRGSSLSPDPKKQSPKPQKNMGSPGDKEEEEEEEEDPNKPKTVTMKCGMIKFQNIVVPPSAPMDLICEECEKSIAVIFCGRCSELFCMRCAELVHPAPYGEEYHPHELADCMRAVAFGDVSKIKLKNEFVMPSIELHEEDYLKVKDLTKPQTLSTSVTAVQPSTTPHLHPKYDVMQVVLFTDPHTEQEAYGKIVSQWDQRHGSMATPAILRGCDTVVFYIVQLMGFTKHVVNIGTLVPSAAVVEKIENYPVIEGVELDEMLQHRKQANKVDKRIAEVAGIVRLGPKHHLRDTKTYGIMKDQIVNDNREFNLRSATQRASSDEVLNSAIYNSNLDDVSEVVTIASSTASHRQLIANKHRRLRMGTNNEYIITPNDYPADLYDNIDLNIYADIDTDVHSQLSHNNPLGHPFPAYYRSYQHVLGSNYHRPGGAGAGAGAGVDGEDWDGDGDDQLSLESSGFRSLTSQDRIDADSQAHRIALRQDALAQQLVDAHSKRIAGRAGAGGAAGGRGLPVQNSLAAGSGSVLTHSILHGSSTAEDSNSNYGYNKNENNYFSGGHSVGGGSAVSAATTASAAAAAAMERYTHQALRILVLSENEICTVQERMASELVRKNNLLRLVWDRMSGSEKVLMKQYGFTRWLGKVWQLFFTCFWCNKLVLLSLFAVLLVMRSLVHVSFSLSCINAHIYVYILYEQQQMLKLYGVMQGIKLLL